MKKILIICTFFAINLLLVAALAGDNISEDVPESKVISAEPSISIVMPGTKWCGPGNTSTGYNDLGILRETDKCCREHDYCNITIPAGNTMYSLYNPDAVERLNCDCEQNLMKCLKRVNSFSSNSVGEAYFAARSKCFDYAYPIVRCLKYQIGLFGLRCISYTFDGTQPMKWQYFDNPYY